MTQQDMTQEEDQKYPINVANLERVLCGLGGLALVGTGLMRAAPGLAIAATGAGLVARGACGHSMLYGRFGLSTARAAKSIVDEPVSIHRSFEVPGTPGQVRCFLENRENLIAMLDTIEGIEPLEEGYRLRLKAGPVRYTCDIRVRSVEVGGELFIEWEPLPSSSPSSSSPSNEHAVRTQSRGRVVLRPVSQRSGYTKVSLEARFTAGRPWAKALATALRPYAWLKLKGEVGRVQKAMTESHPRRNDIGDQTVTPTTTTTTDERACGVQAPRLEGVA